MKKYFVILLLILSGCTPSHLQVKNLSVQAAQEVSCIYLLGLVMFIYICFCMKRKGFHVLSIGWLLGNGYYISSICFFYWYGSYSCWNFKDVCSWRAIIWFWCAILLFILGKEITNYFLLKKTRLENQQALIDQWKLIKYKSTAKLDFVLLTLSFIYLLSCVFIYYKFCPQYMRLFTGSNGIYFRELPKFFHPTFYRATLCFSAFLMFRAFSMKQYRLYWACFCVVTFAILFLPQGKTYVFALYLHLLNPFICFTLFFNSNLNIKKFICLIFIIVCCVCFCSNCRKYCSGFKRLSAQGISTLYLLKQENKQKYGLFFTKRMFLRIFGIDSKLPSLGNFCMRYIRGDKPLDLNSEYEKNDTSFSCNYVGQIDLYFGNLGMLCFFILGVLFSIGEFFIYKNRKFISFFSCFYVFYLSITGLTFSAFESSFVKNGLFFTLLYMFFIEFQSNQKSKKKLNY